MEEDQNKAIKQFKTSKLSIFKKIPIFIYVIVFVILLSSVAFAANEIYQKGNYPIKKSVATKPNNSQLQDPPTAYFPYPSNINLNFDYLAANNAQSSDNISAKSLEKSAASEWVKQVGNQSLTEFKVNNNFEVTGSLAILSYGPWGPLYPQYGVNFSINDNFKDYTSDILEKMIVSQILFIQDMDALSNKRLATSYVSTISDSFGSRLKCVAIKEDYPSNNNSPELTEYNYFLYYDGNDIWDTSHGPRGSYVSSNDPNTKAKFESSVKELGTTLWGALRSQDSFKQNYTGNGA